LTEAAWQKLLKDITPAWSVNDAPAHQVNLEAAFSALTRREQQVVLHWYLHFSMSGQRDDRQINKAIVPLLLTPMDHRDPIVINERQVHAYRMKALAKLKRPDVQRILRRQPDSVAA